MKQKIHIDINGVPSICRASLRECPRGGAQNHYSSMQEAEVYADFFNELESKLLHNRKETFDEEKAKERSKIIEEAMRNPLMERFKTKNFYFDPKLQEWNEEREKQHEEIINSLLENYKDVPCEGKVVFSAGLPGAGKTTVLKSIDNLDIDDYATINSDDIKEMMVQKGMVPEIRGFTPLECANLIHEESSYLADILQNKLASERKNVIFDMTCKNKKSVERRMGVFKNQGYREEDTTMVFVDIEIETSKKRALNRYKEGLNDYFSGKSNLGGRYVPDSVFKACQPTWSNTSSINQEVFRTFQLDENSRMKMIEYDNNGREPRKLDK